MAERDVETATQEPLLASPSGTLYREDWRKTTSRGVYNFLTHVCSCAFFGLLTAFALKAFGTAIAVAIVLLFVAVQVLAYYGYVNVNWSGVRSSLWSRLDINRDGRVDWHDFKAALSWLFQVVLGLGLPTIGGFMFGFWAGWKLL